MPPIIWANLVLGQKLEIPAIVQFKSDDISRQNRPGFCTKRKQNDDHAIIV